MRDERPRDSATFGAALEPGSVIADRFEVVELVDSGGMGSVYRAIDLLDHRRPVAVKVIREHEPSHNSSGFSLGGAEPHTSLDTQQLLDSFQREAELLANLRHPSIVKYVTHGRTSSGAPYLAMEWVEGEDLKTKLRREPLTVAQTLRLGLRVAEGLAAAHRVGVIHRDIKPSNILLPNGNVDQAKIADFGIAQFTQFVLIRGGTPGYMAPELHLERAHIDARADVYSLGLLLTRCLSTTESRESLQGSEDMPTATVVDKNVQAVDGTTLGLSVPTELDDLLRRMLSTDRSLRPAHGGVVASHLQALVSRLDPDDSSVLSAHERQLVGVIRVQLDPRAPPARDAIADVLGKFGATQRTLDLFGLVISLESRVSEGDHTLRTALCALEVRRVCPTAGIALVLGQIPPQTQQSLVTAAERLLEHDTPLEGRGGERPILIDPRAANLFDVRFDVERGDAVCRLLRPRRELAAGRLLLGRPSPWVGRSAEVDRLLLTYLDAVAARAPRAVLLQAEAGMGKSRLAQELLSGLETSSSAPVVWIARGDPVSSGSPFSLLAQLVHAMAGIAEGETMAIRQAKLHRCLAEYFQGAQLKRVEAFIGELSRTPYPSDFNCIELRIARQDPQFMAEQTRRAWEDLIAVVSAKQPLVVVLDDCQWGDLATLRYFDQVMRSRSTGALVLLVLARPGASPWSSLEGNEGFARIQLERLSAADCAAFLRQVLGDGVAPDLVRRLIDRSGGNPLLLEELARAVGQRGEVQLEDTISALIHARLQSLGFDARQILRAASVFGPVFWLDGVVALRQRGSSAAVVREWLDELVDQEVVVRRPTSRYPGEEEYEFHQLAVRDAAYGMLTEEDTIAAHRTVARWLSERGESNSYILAEHFRLGGEPAEAARFYTEAARQAFERNEFEAVREITERALACSTNGDEVQGALELLRAEAESCTGHHAEASRFALQAMEHLPDTSARWLAAAGEASLASARTSDHDRVVEVVKRITDTDPTLSGGGVELTGVVRAALPLASSGHSDTALDLLRSVERALESLAERNPDARGPYHSSRALQGMCEGKIAQSLYEMEAAAREFESAGSLRTAWEHRAGAGFMCLELGLLARGEQLLMEVIRTTEGVGLHHLNATAKHNLGRRLAEVGRTDEGRALEKSALKAFQTHGNRRMQGLTHAFLGRIALREGDPLEAEQHARLGVELLAQESGSKIVALATLAQVLLKVERPEDALVYATQALEQLEGLELVLEGESLTRLAYAEALWGCGRREEALAAIRAAKKNLLERRDKLGSPDVYDSFLYRVHENAEIMRHSVDWPKRS